MKVIPIMKNNVSFNMLVNNSSITTGLIQVGPSDGSEQPCSLCFSVCKATNTRLGICFQSSGSDDLPMEWRHLYNLFYERLIVGNYSAFQMSSRLYCQ